MIDDTAIHGAAQRYMARGWAIIALYGVDEDGNCRCGDRSGGHASGKHPVGAGRRGEGWMPPVGAPEEIPTGANIGLKTGQASGVFALDVDPKNGGDDRLAELEAVHGALPPTWTQRTGSGGTHYLFAMPDDFSPTNSRGRLPLGLDIRGEGGQIVMAPSRSAVGGYAEMGGTVSAPPAWLLDKIRPQAPVELRTAVAVEPLSVALPPGRDPRLTAYMESVVRGEMQELDGAQPGARNQTAFNVACRVWELVNAERQWTALTQEQGWQLYTAAGVSLIAPDFPESELIDCWSNARRSVNGKMAIAPAPPGGMPNFHEFGELGGPPGVPPFSSNGSGGATVAPGPVAAGAIPAQRDPFEDAGVYHGPAYGADAAPGAGPVQADGLRGLLVPRSQMGRLPRPVPLIQGTLWRDTDAWLIGASGSGKSFIALDWAAHVAAGVDWNNRRTTQGRVLYLVAEGASGMQQRLDAWEAAQVAAAKRSREKGVEHHAVMIPDDLIILPVAVQAIARAGREVVLSPHWRELMGIVTEMAPDLIVLDTQARISLGLNENDNAEMGQFIQAVGSLRQAAGGACVLVVHHTGRNGGDARGASAIDGAQDVEWKVERRQGQMSGELVMEKNKNGADGVRHPFVLQPHKLGYDYDADEPVTSLSVSFDPFDRALPEGGMDFERDLSTRQNELRLVIEKFGSPQGDTLNQLAGIVKRWVAQRAEASLPTSLATGRGVPVDSPTIKNLLTRDGKNGTDGLVGAGLVTLVPGAAPRYADPARYEKYVNGELSPDSA